MSRERGEPGRFSQAHEDDAYGCCVSTLTRFASPHCPGPPRLTSTPASSHHVTTTPNEHLRHVPYCGESEKGSQDQAGCSLSRLSRFLTIGLFRRRPKGTRTREDREIRERGHSALSKRSFFSYDVGTVTTTSSNRTPSRSRPTARAYPILRP